MLEKGECARITELAAAEKIDRSYLCRVLRLTLLAPEIVEGDPEHRALQGSSWHGCSTERGSSWRLRVMSGSDWTTVNPDGVLGFWFPEDGHAEKAATHQAFWLWRMRGEADAEIRRRFADLTKAAARGRLDHWSANPRGRLALVVVLDQFSRAIWRDCSGAFAQDIKAARLVLDALDNGHFDALTNVWEKAFCLIALGHCEGPDHLVRMARVEALTADLLEAAPPHLKVVYRLHQDQARLAGEVIGAFGRHPHRNAALGRLSTVAEEPYLAAGRFPHQRPISEDLAEVEALLARREHLARRNAST